MNKLRKIALALLLMGPVPPVLAASEPSSAPKLTLKAGNGSSSSFTADELLARKDLETLVIQDDPAYPGRTMTYKAVPLWALFKDLALEGDAVVQFRCLDGFSAPLSRDRLLAHGPNQSRAMIAVEPQSTPWPPLKSGGPSAGPFYLVWDRPELSRISREEWPYQLAAFEVKGRLKDVYPKIFPAAAISAQDPVQKGFRVFTQNCFACHTVNRNGASDVGPDLNVPMSPTEYLTKEALRKLIRDPQSVRYYPKAKMPPFPSATLSDQELDHLIAYLSHMAKTR